MTAINTLALSSSVHVFADRGHYATDLSKLVSVSPKYWELPHWNSVILVCGRNILAETIHRALIHVPRTANKRMAFVTAARETVAPLIQSERYTLYFMGFDPEEGPICMTIEEGFQVVDHPVPCVTKSIAPAPDFDLRDIPGSGLRMMEYQRERFQLVAGACDYIRLDARGTHVRTLKEWPVRG